MKDCAIVLITLLARTKKWMDRKKMMGQWYYSTKLVSLLPKKFAMIQGIHRYIACFSICCGFVTVESDVALMLATCSIFEVDNN